jgi:hypothetical protein
MRRVMMAAAMVLGCAAYVSAQDQACPMEMMKDPKLTLGEMYAKSEARAKAWKPDVVVASITNTTMGPLDEAGKSEAWNLMFWSPAANQQVNISTFRGMFNCYAMPGAAGRLPNLKPGFFTDGAKLYAIAKQQGGQYLGQGYFIMIGTAAAPSDRHATWNITYSSKDSKSAPLLVLVDANTGSFEKAIKD